MLKQALAISTVASSMILWMMLVATSPSTVGPLGILFFFTLMYVSILGVSAFLLHIASMLIVRMRDLLKFRSRVRALSLRESYYFASVVALAPVMLVAMQSVSEVGVYQFFLVVLFVVIALTYVAKRTK